MTASLRILASLALASISSHALAENTFTPGTLTEEQASKRYVVDLGVAGFVNPRYDGADEYIIYPLPLIAFSRFFYSWFWADEGRFDAGCLYLPLLRIRG